MCQMPGLFNLWIPLQAHTPLNNTKRLSENICQLIVKEWSCDLQFIGCGLLIASLCSPSLTTHCKPAGRHHSTQTAGRSLSQTYFQAKLLFPFLTLPTFHSYRFIFYFTSVLGLPYFCCCSSHFVHPLPNLSHWFCKYFRHELASILIVYYSRIFFP